MTDPENRELVEDETVVREFMESAVEIVGVTLMATIGFGDPMMPPVMYVARAPGFDFTDLPGMGDEGAKASANDWRWGILKDDKDNPWASLELWWPNGQERRLKINLQRHVRNLFPMLVELASPSGIAEFGISSEKAGMPTAGLLGIQIDTNDEMFGGLTYWVRTQPPLEDDRERETT